MLERERLIRITKILERDKAINVEDAAKLFDVSTMTIRRDLDKISKSNDHVSRCHGGAIVLKSVQAEDGFEGKLSINVSEKRLIALKAFQLVKENDVIYIDAGTTTYELAKIINQSNLNITVILNDITIARELSRDGITVIVTGGNLQKATWCLLGNIAESVLKRFKPDIAFMGCSAIDEDFNVLTPTIEKTTMKNLVVNSSIKSYLLADKDKFYKHSPYIIYTLADFTGVITDKIFIKAEQEYVEDMGAEIISV